MDLIGGADLGDAEIAGNTRLAGGSTRRAQRRRCRRRGARLQRAELNGAIEASEEACELRRGVRKSMGGRFGRRLQGGGRSEAPELAAAVEAGWTTIALVACALEQSEVEQMGEG